MYTEGTAELILKVVLKVNVALRAADVSQT